MEPRIETAAAKKLIGVRLTMSLANNRTGELWRSFMPRRKEIRNSVGSTLYSVQRYDPGYFEDFKPGREFEKRAALEVTDFGAIPGAIPDEMEAYTLPGGLYAVFDYKGPSTDDTVFHYIYTSWLPKSDYVLDNRPHFEVLGEKYKNGDPNSEEAIWIPIRPKE